MATCINNMVAETCEDCRNPTMTKRGSEVLVKTKYVYKGKSYKFQEISYANLRNSSRFWQCPYCKAWNK